jgi:tetratricopeptide (TPR) repeat protein
VDGEKGEGLDIAKEYKLQGFPTFVFADASGAVMDTWAGYGKEFFLGRMAEAVADPTTVDQKRARFEKEPTASDAVKLARYHATRGEGPAAVSLYEEAAALDSESDYAWELFETTFYGFREEQFEIADLKKRAENLFAVSGIEPSNLGYAVQMLNSAGRKVEDPQLAAPYLAPAIAALAASEDPAHARARASLEVEHAVLVEKDLDKAVRLKRATLPEGWMDDAGALNSFAWWCFENSVNLEEAEALGRRGVELAPAGPDRASILDTVAEICNARGNCDDAVELIQRAIEDHPDKEYYKKQLERFRQIRAARAN